MKPSPVTVSFPVPAVFLPVPFHALPTSSSLPALQFASLLVCRAWLDVWLVVRQLSDLYVLFNIIMAGRFAAGTRCCLGRRQTQLRHCNGSACRSARRLCKMRKIEHITSSGSRSHRPPLPSHSPRATCSAFRVRVHVHVPCPCGRQ